MENKHGNLILCILLFSAGILAMPANVLSEGVLWISAFCNYALPTGMVFLEILLIQRFIYNREHYFHWSDPLIYCYAFLCGATTEQMGAVSTMITLLFLLKCIILKNKRCISCFIVSFCSTAGLFSILRSPATQRRFDSETISDITQRKGFFPHIAMQLDSQAELLQEITLIILAVTVLFISTGYFLIASKRIHSAFGALWLSAALTSLSVFWFSEGTILRISYIAILCLILIQAVIYLAADYDGLAMIQLSALSSVGVMLFTASGGNRTLIPFILCILASLSYILSALLMKTRPSVFISTILLPSTISFAIIAVQLPAYWHNYQVDKINQNYAAHSEENGAVYYCIDYDQSHTHSKIYNDGYYYLKWIEAEKIDTSKYNIYLYGENLPNVYVNDIRSTSPALAGKNGEWLLPLRYIVSSLGGTVESEDIPGTRLNITINNKVFYYIAQDSYVKIQWQDENGIMRSMTGERATDYFETCISEKIYTEAFDLETFHKNNNIHVGFKPQ